MTSKPKKFPKFLLNEKVICEHKDDFFQAKCIDIRRTKSGFRYYVHYVGWNDQWNEWCHERRIFKITKENFAKRGIDPPKNLKLLTDEELRREQASRLQNAEEEFTQARASGKIATPKSQQNSAKKAGREHDYETTEFEHSSDDDDKSSDSNSKMTKRDKMKMKKGAQEKRPFPCNVCSFSSQSKSDLEAHLASHNEERPYICKLCGLGFKAKHGLIRHKRIVHSSDRPFVCKKCSLKFKSKKSLMVHNEKHSDILSCEKCGKEFASSRKVEIHCQTAHPPKSTSTTSSIGGKKKPIVNSGKSKGVSDEASTVPPLEDSSALFESPPKKKKVGLKMDRRKSLSDENKGRKSKNNLSKRHSHQSPLIIINSSVVEREEANEKNMSKVSKRISLATPKELESASFLKPIPTSESSESSDNDDDSQENETTCEGDESNAEDTNKKKIFSVPLPQTIQFILVHDFDLINFRNSLCHLPAKNSIKSILGNFLEENRNSDIGIKTDLADLAGFLQNSFNTLINKQLLYAQEKSQFDAIMASMPEKTPVEIYGGSHLLRLMAKIPKILNKEISKMLSAKEVLNIEAALEMLYAFLVDHKVLVFSESHYFVPNPLDLA